MTARYTPRYAFAFCLLLAGCAVNEKDIAIATDICKDHKGILFLWASSDSVTCKDGFKADYTRMQR